VTRGFGFRIDYDRAIAQDDRVIAWAERSIERGWDLRTVPYSAPALGSCEVNELWMVALYFPDALPGLGLTAHDVANMAQAMDMYDEAANSHPGLPRPDPGAPGFRRGEEVFSGLQEMSFGGMRLHRDEAAERSDRRRTMASRARHVRNREKFGHSRGGHTSSAVRRDRPAPG
jgi:hypothetical protein